MNKKMHGVPHLSFLSLHTVDSSSLNAGMTACVVQSRCRSSFPELLYILPIQDWC